MSTNRAEEYVERSDIDFDGIHDIYYNWWKQIFLHSILINDTRANGFMIVVNTKILINVFS